MNLNSVQQENLKKKILMRESKEKYEFLANSYSNDTNAEILDFLVEKKELKTVLRFIRVNKCSLSESLRAKIQKIIVDENNAEMAYEFYCIDKNFDSQTMLSVIMLSNDSRIAYMFAKISCDEAIIKRLEDVVCCSQDSSWCAEFASEIQGANVSRLEDRIIRVRDISSCLEFIKIVPTANISRFDKLFIRENNPELSYEFVTLNFIKGARDIASHADIVINSGNFDLCYKFARDVEMDVLYLKKFEVACRMFAQNDLDQRKANNLFTKIKSKKFEVCGKQMGKGIVD